MNADMRHEPVFMNVLCSCFEAPRLKHYECVNWRVQMPCLISFSFFYVYGYELETRTKSICRKQTNKKIRSRLRSDYWSFPETLLFLICSLSKTFSCDRLVKKGRKVVQKKETNRVLWQSVHTLFKLTFENLKKKEKRNKLFGLGFFFCFFVWMMMDSCSLFTWKVRNV